MKKQRVHSCSVVEVRPNSRHLWHFENDRDQVALKAEQSAPSGGALPQKYVLKDWQTLWQPRINIAFLPAEKVFLRVVQLPIVEYAEMLSMLEFQLEKLSPLPVAQIVWSAEILPSRVENEQTAIVCVVERNAVEEFLGKLEADDFQPDRLEVPEMDQIVAGGVKQDGAWLYPSEDANRDLCVAAWWSEGTLQNLQLLRLPAENAGPILREQLTQASWAGELEGWLSLPVQWHVVATGATAAAWQEMTGGWAGESIHFEPVLSVADIAKFSAERAVRGANAANLIPLEFSARYHQQFIDRLWMRGLFATVALYCVGVVIYFIALHVYGFRQGKVQAQVANLSGAYTNALQLKERVAVLQDQVNLKYAALDCWKAASEFLPEEFTLTWLVFTKGSNLELHGTAPSGQEEKITDYNEALRGAVANGQPLFSNVSSPRSTSRPGSASLTWTFGADLNRSDTE